MVNVSVHSKTIKKELIKKTENNISSFFHMQQQPNLEEDSSPLSPGSEGTILALKKARKQIEADAQLLANRIALLKQEELKSWKKIEETKKKAKEVYLLKKKNEEKIREVLSNDLLFSNSLI